MTFSKIALTSATSANETEYNISWQNVDKERQIVYWLTDWLVFNDNIRSISRREQIL